MSETQKNEMKNTWMEWDAARPNKNTALACSPQNDSHDHKAATSSKHKKYKAGTTGCSIGCSAGCAQTIFLEDANCSFMIIMTFQNRIELNSTNRKTLGHGRTSSYLLNSELNDARHCFNMFDDFNCSLRRNSISITVCSAFGQSGMSFHST